MPAGYSDFGEDVIRDGLASRGWFVIPTAKINAGGAPMARNCDNALILPDLQIAARGKSLWVEVKRKTKPGFMRKTNRKTHGFCKRQWEHYKSIEEETGVQVWLFIWVTSTKTICYAPIGFLFWPQIREPGEFLDRTPQNKSDFCEHGMVFFGEDDFWQMDETQFLEGKWNDHWLIKRW